MPLHSYKTFVGLAADRVNASLSAPTAIGATSLPVVNVVGTPGATFTAFIVDGALTESVACTAGVVGGAIAVAATANAHLAGTYVYFQLTASKGPTAYLPLDKFDPSDKYAQLLDQSYRGSAVKTVGAVQGLRTSTWDVAGAVFADTLGYVLGGVFGAEDFTTGTPNTHTFSVLNSGASQLQPVSYVFYNYNSLNTRIYCGKFTEIGLTLDPAQLMKFTTKVLARASGVTTTPVPSFSNLTPVPAWTGSATVAGAPTAQVVSFDITFTRSESEAIPNLDGSQDPYAIFVGPVEGKGKFLTVKEDDVLYGDLVTEAQPAVVISSSQGTGASATALNIQMTKCNFDDVKIGEQGKAYVTEEVSFEAIANTTDATTSGTGLSPGRVVLKNAVATGIYV